MHKLCEPILYTWSHWEAWFLLAVGCFVATLFIALM